MPPLNADLHRQAAELRLQRAETAVEAVVLDAVGRWLQTIRFLIIREAADLLGANPSRALDVATGANDEWRRALTEVVLPAIAAVHRGDGETVTAAAGREFWSQNDYAVEYMQSVHDRLAMWPEGEFEKMRPDLIESLQASETVEELTARIGRSLSLDKKSSALKQEITEVEARLMDDDNPLDPATRKELAARRRRLWKEHDAELSAWQWKARRIARTEAHAALNAGQIAVAQARAELTGGALFKRWLATADHRTRVTHRIADGQLVKLDERFQVGAAQLAFPGDPTGPGREVIQCRCSLRIEDEITAQEQLQGPDGSMGEVRPGGVRRGPDSPDAVQRALAESEGATGQASGYRPAKITNADHWGTLADAAERPDRQNDYGHIFTQQGWDGPMQELDDESFSAFQEPSPAPPIYRGCHPAGDKSAAEVHRMFINGESPWIGEGVRGAGWYTTDRFETSLTYSDARDRSAIGLDVIEMLFRPEARILDGMDIPKTVDRAEWTLWAAKNGYDAVKLPAPRIGESYYVILNRSAVVVRRMVQ